MGFLCFCLLLEAWGVFVIGFCGGGGWDECAVWYKRSEQAGTHRPKWLIPSSEYLNPVHQVTADIPAIPCFLVSEDGGVSVKTTPRCRGTSLRLGSWLQSHSSFSCFAFEP